MNSTKRFRRTGCQCIKNTCFKQFQCLLLAYFFFCPCKFSRICYTYFQVPFSPLRILNNSTDDSIIYFIISHILLHSNNICIKTISLNLISILLPLVFFHFSTKRNIFQNIHYALWLFSMA